MYSLLFVYACIGGKFRPSKWDIAGLCSGFCACDVADEPQKPAPFFQKDSQCAPPLEAPAIIHAVQGSAAAFLRGKRSFFQAQWCNFCHLVACQITVRNGCAMAKLDSLGCRKSEGQRPCIQSRSCMLRQELAALPLGLIGITLVNVCLAVLRHVLQWQPPPSGTIKALPVLIVGFLEKVPGKGGRHRVSLVGTLRNFRFPGVPLSPLTALFFPSLRRASSFQVLLNRMQWH